MGHRTMKRVPLDFSAPLNETWHGYINPHPGPTRCEPCDGTGYNQETKKISDGFYNFDGDRGDAWHDKITQDEVQVLVDADRLWDFTHTWGGPEKRWMRRDDGYIPSAAEVNAFQSGGRMLGTHDAINRGILIEARAKRLGVYGSCLTCDGEGEIPNTDPTIRKLYDEWKEEEPPTGEGYQLWETVTEGSPISPVFSHPEQLAEWCAQHATIFASERLTAAQWLKMFRDEDPEAVDIGSMFIAKPGYLGTIANEPK